MSNPGVREPAQNVQSVLSEDIERQGPPKHQSHLNKNQHYEFTMIELTSTLIPLYIPPTPL